MIRLFLFLVLKFIIGAEAGGSFPWSSKWQSKTIFGHTLQQLPEAVDALILAHLALTAYALLGLDLTQVYTLGLSHYHIGLSLGAWLYPVVFFIIYAGIQSATWMILQWTGHKNPGTDRDATLKPIVDKISRKFGWSLGDEGYSWVAATAKGSIICLPVGLILAPIGGLLFALGYEAGSHAQKKKYRNYIPFNPHIISEGLSFAGIGLFYYLALELCKLIGT